MPEREKRVFVRKGGSVRLVLEGGSIVDISHPSLKTPFKLEQRSLDSREAQREQLKARYPDILFPYINSRLTQHGYKVLGGGEEISAELTSLEGQVKLKQWIEEAKKLGISNQEISQQTKDLLNQVHIGTPRSGTINPLINGINTDISTLVDEVWGVKNKRRQTSTLRKK